MHIPAEPKEVFNAALAGVAAAFQSGDASLLLGADDMLQQLQEAQVCAHQSGPLEPSHRSRVNWGQRFKKLVRGAANEC